MGKFIGLTALLILFCACSLGPGPRQTAEGYLGALAKLDFPAAAGFVADEGRSNFEFLGKLYAGLGPEERKKFQVTDWKVTGEAVNGDTATVDFTFDGAKKGQLNLIRSGGFWKVDHRRTF